MIEVVEPAYLAEHSVVYTDAAGAPMSEGSYSPEETELARERLQALGCID